MLGNLSRGNEQRALTYQTIWGSGGDLYGTYSESGARVDGTTALQINAFYACVLLISDTISTLPVDCFQRKGGTRYPFRPRPSWVGQPDVDLLRTEHFQQALISMLIDGNAFIRIFRDNTGQVVNLVTIDPTRVQVDRDERTKRIIYVIDGVTIVRSDEMLHITEMRKAGQLRGVSRVDELKNNLGLSSALQSFAARFFAQGATTTGIIETPQALNKEQSRDLSEGFDGKHAGFRKAHKTGVLTGGAKFVRTGVNPDEAQMLDSQKFAVEQIARIFRVPPHMIGITSAGSMSYNSVEQQNINFVTHTLRPYIAKLEDAYSKLLPSDVFIRFNVDGLLRGDFQTRMQGYSIGSQAGFLSVNDIHRFEDMPPVEGGDVYRVPLANVDLSAANLVEQKQKVEMAQKLINSGFNPMDVMAKLGLPAIEHTGVPSVQLQGVAQIDPEDPNAVYGV